jgi:GNAT superfamily N-acetyltransferase
MDETKVGVVRLLIQNETGRVQISPIFILPDYQNQGIAQKAFTEIESLFQPNNGWILQTIEEEEGNCHLYEKIGYVQSGATKRINNNMHIITYEKRDNLPNCP